MSLTLITYQDISINRMKNSRHVISLSKGVWDIFFIHQNKCISQKAVINLGQATSIGKGIGVAAPFFNQRAPVFSGQRKYSEELPGTKSGKHSQHFIIYNEPLWKHSIKHKISYTNYAAVCVLQVFLVQKDKIILYMITWFSSNFKIY